MCDELAESMVAVGSDTLEKRCRRKGSLDDRTMHFGMECWKTWFKKQFEEARVTDKAISGFTAEDVDLIVAKLFNAVSGAQDRLGPVSDGWTQSRAKGALRALIEDTKGMVAPGGVWKDNGA